MASKFFNVGVLLRLTVGSGAAAFITLLHAWLLLSYSTVEGYGWFAFVLVVAALMAAAQQAVVLTPLLLHQPVSHAGMGAGKNDAIHDATHGITSDWQLLAVVFLVCCGGLVFAATYLNHAMSFTLAQNYFNSPIQVEKTLSDHLLHLQQPWVFAAINTLFVTSFMLRQYCRAYAIQKLQSDLAARSDWCFSAIALILTIVIWLCQIWRPIYTPELPLINVQTLLICLCIAQVAGVIILKNFMQQSLQAECSVFRQKGWRLLSRAGWHDFRRWSLPALWGVVAVEASVNLHHYLLTLWHGPAVYAPFAFILLLFRPLALLQHNLVQHERAKLITMLHGPETLKSCQNNQLASHQQHAFAPSSETQIQNLRQWLSRLQRQTFVAWLLNLMFLVLVLVALRYGQPDFLQKLCGPLQQQLVALYGLMTGCAILCLARALRAPCSALLQAHGDILWLSQCSSWQVFIGIPLFGLVLWLLPYLWILLPMLVLEFWLCWMLHQRCKKIIMGPMHKASSC